MGLYRKKPVVIEAFQWFPASPVSETPEWFFAACASGGACPELNGTVTIKTLEGTHTASIGDYIIQGVKGELYPCKPDIFHMTYEAQEE